MSVIIFINVMLSPGLFDHVLTEDAQALGA